MLGLSFMYIQELWPDSQLTRQGSTNGSAALHWMRRPLSSLSCHSRCCGKEDKKQSKSRLILPQCALLAPSTAILAHQ